MLHIGTFLLFPRCYNLVFLEWADGPFFVFGSAFCSSAKTDGFFRSARRMIFRFQARKAGSGENVSHSSDRIAELIRPAVTALGVELWGVEHIIQGRHSVLRIFIDKEGDGVTIDDCEKVSRQVSGIFDVEDPIAGEYNLEVSSPGMDRPLFEREQFARYVGSVVAIRLNSPLTVGALSGRRKFKGEILQVDEDALSVQIDDKEVVLPFSAIDKANLVY